MCTQGFPRKPCKSLWLRQPSLIPQSSTRVGSVGGGNGEGKSALVLGLEAEPQQGGRIFPIRIIPVLKLCVHPGAVCPSWVCVSILRHCVDPGAMCPSLSELCVPLVHPSCSWKQELFIAPSLCEHHTNTSPPRNVLLPNCCSSRARLLPTPAVINTKVLEPGGRARY